MLTKKYIEDICFFEVNTKYISSSELKTSEFSRMRSSRDEIYLVVTEKSKFSFYFIQYTGIFQFTRQVVKMQKTKFFEKPNNFGTTLLVPYVLTKKMNTNT